MEKHRQRVQKLNDKGFECLNAHDFDKAIKIGKHLRKLHYSSAFEILGLAYAKQGKLQKAIAILEEGVEKAPAVWLLWQLLGNYYSDSGKHKKALRAYQSALNCPSADESSVEYNIAIVLQRRNRFDDALQYVDRALNRKVDSAILELSARATKISLLNTMNQHEQANALADEILERKSDYEARAEGADALSVVQTQFAEIPGKGKTMRRLR